MSTRSARMVVCSLAMLAMPTAALAQDSSSGMLDSLLSAHLLPMTLHETQASGPGFDLLVDGAAASQFVIIGEEHNLLELNKFAVALFDTLHARYDFQHLVLEQGNIIASWLDDAARRGGLDAVNALVRTYPHAPTFATDEELELIAHVRSVSTASGPAVWGVDQELAAMHLLERLAQLSVDEEARAEFTRLADEARPYERTRTGDIHYLYTVADPHEYQALSTLQVPLDDPEARTTLEALQRTVRLYTGRRQALGAYASGFEREWSMRDRFMERYRAAVAAGAPAPRAIVKMGHWHTLRGIFQSDVPTFGNFLTEFAAANGMHTLVVATYVVNGADEWRNTGGALARVSDPNGISVIDMRPLRPLAHEDKIPGLTGAWHDLVFQADLLLVVGGGRTGSYAVAHGDH